MIDSESLNESYLEWLVTKVGGFRYLSLCEQLFNTEFKWHVPNDDNRDEDGRLLRIDFLDEFELEATDKWLKTNCSMLELILGVSHRLSYESDIEFDVWFWELIENIGLIDFHDLNYTTATQKQIDRATKRINDRTYEVDGLGGLFPLKNNKEDQRKIEIWYQMSAYLLENNLMY